MYQESDIQSFRRLLNEIAEMCDHATLTGSLSGGARRAAERYNATLAHLVKTGAVPDGLFAPVELDSGYAEIGVEARMLCGYFPSQREQSRYSEGGGGRNMLIRLAPFVGREELGLLVREQTKDGITLDMNTLTSLAPFLGQDVLGDLIRRNLVNGPAKPGQPAAKPAPPEQPAPAAHAAPAAPAQPEPAAAAKPDYRPEPVSAENQSVDELLDLLKSPYLSDEERGSIVEKLKAARS